jgi:hypothetical protein
VALGAEDIRIYEGILRAPSYTLTFTPERGGERIYGKIRMMVFPEPQLHSVIHAIERRRAYLW